MRQQSLLDLQDAARRAKRKILLMSYQAQVGHIPSALSMVDYLTVVFSRHVDPHVDKVILGKPFGAQAYYAVFSECGWIQENWERYGSEDTEWRYTMAREHSLLTFMDDTMGNTLSVACGIATAFSGTVYLNVSDAYLQAGSVWEAIMYAGHNKLSNIIMTIDNNNMQVLGHTNTILDVEPISERLTLFGWKTFTSDGHKTSEISHVLEAAFANQSKPTAIIMNTEKGHGVSFMKDRVDWHYRTLTRAELDEALKEIA